MKLAALLLLTAGCATVEPRPELTDAEIRAQLEAGFRKSSLDRAAFDLRCAADALQIRVLNAVNGLGAQVGVECGERRMVYVYQQVGQVAAAWVAESGSAAHDRRDAK